MEDQNYTIKDIARMAGMILLLNLPITLTF